MKSSKTPKSTPGAITETGPISDASVHKVAASKAFLETHYRSLMRDSKSGAPRVVGPREKNTSMDDFQLIKCIGKGGFGEVYVCQRKGDASQQLYALKRMRKVDMIRLKQVTHVRSEKDVLSEAALKNPWVVKLYASFQDDKYLYMLMEYMPGCDMISWLCDKGIFDVDSSRFYIAELCAAVASVHDMYFVHRDIKPDNILFGSDGHIKLSDFGLSKRFAKGQEELLDLEEALPSSTSGPSDGVATIPRNDHELGTVKHVRERATFDSIVGSYGYIAPEILLHQRYGVNCDWWSVGVIMYEMIYGIPPFYSQDPNTTRQKIVHWKEHLHFPSGADVPPEAVDFMKRLMCDPQDRMDYVEIKAHPFMQCLDMDHLRDMRAAYIPVLSNPLDTRYFPEIDEHALRPRRDGAEDREVKEVDPRGVMFADFQYNVNSQRK